MLKISESKPSPAFTLRLEGRVVGPWVEELRQIAEMVLSDQTKLALDLAEISYADENGLALLRSLQARDVTLLNPTPFLREQLRSAVET